MKKWENFKINGESFEVNTKESVIEDGLYGYDSIYDAYTRPSQTKIAIWERWENWFYSNHGYCVVSSRNCNFFSIAGYVTDEITGFRYHCYITASHNKAWQVVEG